MSIFVLSPQSLSPPALSGHMPGFLLKRYIFMCCLTDVTILQTRLLLGDLGAVNDSNYAGSIAFALGCIHRR